MSIENVSAEMSKGCFPAPSSTVVKIVNVYTPATARNGGSRKACLFAYGTSVPSGVVGYLSSCIFLDTDAAADAQLLVNEGTLSSCSFVAQTT